MKKMFSTSYSSAAFNIALLLLRVCFGGYMMWVGYQKLIHFEQMSPFFKGYLGLPPKVALGLLVFAEFFCAALVIIGLFTRLATIPLLISGFIAFFQAHHGQLFQDPCNNGQEMMTGIIPYLVAWLVILLVGPGKASIDGMASK